MIRLDKSKIYIAAIAATVLIAGIGYAFLSSDLSLNGIINVKKHEQQEQTNPEEQPICKRATTLHTETCTNTNQFACAGAGGTYYDGQTVYPSGGYNIGDTITYGSLGTTGTLASGDAFDCDVNGDGIYNSSNERFYYVSSLGTDSNYGVLIYYNNVSGGSPSNNTSYAYDLAGNPRENGPATAVQQLPTTTQWKNVRLSNTTRKIKDENGTEYIDFSYEGYSERLLTVQEITSGCGITTNTGTVNIVPDSCKYLLENTVYSNTIFKDGYWLENPSGTESDYVWIVKGDHRLINDGGYVSMYDDHGVRPAIEVSKNRIEY